MAVLHDLEAAQADDQEAPTNELVDETSAPDLDECQSCGAHVTEQFRRVFGDDNDVAHRCIQCDTTTRLQKGSAAGREVDHADPEDQPWRIRNSHASGGGAF